MGFGAVGKVWTPETFEDYLGGISAPSRWEGICIHHCAAPSLAQRPNGFQLQHIQNMKEFYQSKGWSSSPHLYTDEDQIWGMCPVTEKGIHAKSFNSTHLGIEMLGDFDSEDPLSGRGRKVLAVTAQAAASLLEWIGKEPVMRKSLNFHRHDPQTSKTCPGTKVKEDYFLDLVKSYMGGAKQPASKEVPVKVIAASGAEIPGCYQLDGVTFAPAFPLGRAYGMSDDAIKAGLEATEGDFYDKGHERTMANLRLFCEALPVPSALSWSESTKTVTMTRAGA